MWILIAVAVDKVVSNFWGNMVGWDELNTTIIETVKEQQLIPQWHLANLPLILEYSLSN